MSELTLLILRFAFLAVLWAFVFAVVYALRSDLFGQKKRNAVPDAAVDPFSSTPAAQPAPSPAAFVPAPQPAQQQNTQNFSSPSPANPAVRASRLVITGGPKEGLEIELPNEQLSIGRSSESGLVIRDDYTSTHHARLMLWNGAWVIQDLDSTNGTYLDGKRVTVPQPIPLGAPIKIGTTTFELRR